jgi:transglutaminase-like putative cysteine protease
VTDVSPLTALTAWRSGPDQVLFEAEAPAPTRWPLAVLDQFDGDSWTSSGRFLRAQTGEVGRGHPASLRVTLRDLDGVFLPSALGLTRVSGPNLAINAPLHTVITPGGARAPLTYNIYASAPRRLETRELVALRPANDAQARASLALPGRTDDLRQLARSITRTTAAPYAKAERIAQYLRASYGFDPAAPGGHTIGDIDDFLIHSHRGTSEQFAATFAVLARAAGLPTRIVVGFTAGSRAEGTDTYEVHAHDAVAWDEVDFAGLGWLPFYPTPDTTKVIDDYSLLGAAAPQGQPTTPPPPVTHVHGPPPTTQHTAARPHRHPQADLLRCLLGLIALLMLVYLTAVLVVPRRRRRRRRVVRSPQLRVLGAWLDGLEALDAAGIRVPPSATADEVTVLGGDAVHGSLAPLARLAVASLYAAHITTADEANAAWAYRDRLAAELRHQRGPARHLASVLSPHRLRSSATPRRQARRRMAAQEPQIQESR